MCLSVVFLFCFRGDHTVLLRRSYGVVGDHTVLLRRPHGVVGDHTVLLRRHCGVVWDHTVLLLRPQGVVWDLTALLRRHCGDPNALNQDGVCFGHAQSTRRHQAFFATSPCSLAMPLCCRGVNCVSTARRLAFWIRLERHGNAVLVWQLH